MKNRIRFLAGALAMTGCFCLPHNFFAAEGSGDTLQIVATVFPEYDWVMNILGDNPAGAEVTMLMDKGVDFHSYQPTAEDILRITSCDMLIYVGGESDAWLENLLEQNQNDQRVQMNLLELMGSEAKEEEIVEGMEHEEHEEHDAHEENKTAGEAEYDEHVWLSLGNAKKLTQAISDQLQLMDAANAELYQENTRAYLEKLSELDQRYQDTVSAAQGKTLLFGDRFPFRYLTDDYGLDYYAAFAGCSAETEASFETIAFLAGKVDELSLHSVLVIEGTDHRVAETIVNSTKAQDQKILTMDSMQAVTAQDVQNGISYLQVMEDNLEVLGEALQ